MLFSSLGPTRLYLTLIKALLAVVLLHCSSCSPSYSNFCVEGADEFVCDSYKIRGGKLAVLDMQGHCVGELPCDAMEEYTDFVYEDDILNIAIYHPTRKDLMESVKTINETIGFKVVDGMVNIPDLEPLKVAGLTLTEAGNYIQEKFREQIQDIEVFVTYKDRLSRRVELSGLVTTSTIPVDGKIRLFETLSKAHIAPNANLFMSYVLRDGCPLPIDLHQLIHKGDMCQNIVMRGGDKIFIANPQDARIMVMGEVFHPVPIDLPYGFMSLREALVSAGGIPYTGDRNHIQVIRGNLARPKIYVLSWEHIVHLPNESLLLMPGDTIYISEKPITSWNRFISQILPSFTGFQTGYTLYKILD